MTPGDLLSALADKADDLVDKAADRGFDAVLDAGDKLAQEVPDQDAKEGIEAVASLLAENKDKFVALSAVEFARLLAEFAEGDEEAAKNRYIATEATYEERRAWMQQGGDLAYHQAKARAEAWETVKDVLKTVVTTGLPFALKIASKAVGL